jgi:hypothetical protein
MEKPGRVTFDVRFTKFRPTIGAARRSRNCVCSGDRARRL